MDPPPFQKARTSLTVEWLHPIEVCLHSGLAAEHWRLPFLLLVRKQELRGPNMVTGSHSQGWLTTTGIIAEAIVFLQYGRTGPNQKEQGTGERLADR